MPDVTPFTRERDAARCHGAVRATITAPCYFTLFDIDMLILMRYSRLYADAPAPFVVVHQRAIMRYADILMLRALRRYRCHARVLLFEALHIDMPRIRAPPGARRAEKRERIFFSSHYADTLYIAIHAIADDADMPPAH